MLLVLQRKRVDRGSLERGKAKDPDSQCDKNPKVHFAEDFMARGSSQRDKAKVPDLQGDKKLKMRLAPEFDPMHTTILFDDTPVQPKYFPEYVDNEQDYDGLDNVSTDSMQWCQWITR